MQAGKGFPLTCYTLRLTPGQEIMTTLKKFVEDNHLKAPFIMTCVGSVTKATLRMADSVTINTYGEQGHMEIVSLVGTLSAGGHVHGSFSDKNGHVIGGHVMGGLEVFTTVEIVIGEVNGEVHEREHDKATGYPELVVK